MANSYCLDGTIIELDWWQASSCLGITEISCSSRIKAHCIRNALTFHIQGKEGNEWLRNYLEEVLVPTSVLGKVSLWHVPGKEAILPENISNAASPLSFLLFLLVPFPSPGHPVSGDTGTCPCVKVAWAPQAQLIYWKGLLLHLLNKTYGNRPCRSSGSIIPNEINNHMSPASLLVKYGEAGYLNLATKENPSIIFCDSC